MTSIPETGRRTDPARCELAVVMPVYNEEGCIEPVIRAWQLKLAGLGIPFVMLVINDGSGDGTASQLARFSADERIRVLDQPNEGHGPTVLRGYRMAVELAEWVFQLDSDGEIPPPGFDAVWAARGRADFVFGVRTGRRQPAVRRLMTRVSRLVVRLAGGGVVADANVPFRLMRANRLAAMLPLIPPGTFAPNVAIAGLAGIRGETVANVPVPHEQRRVGRGSLTGFRTLFRAARLSMAQTAAILWRSRRCAS